jgi:hypothetical protein
MRCQISFLGLFILFCFPIEVCLCPANEYPSDAWPHTCKPCPQHTAPTGPSFLATSIHDCKCLAGFLCLYYKQIRATVTLNSTLAAFTQNVGEIQSKFLSGVAAAAGVSPTQVHVRFVVIRLDHRRLRRLLLVGEEVIQVGLLVSVGSENGLDNRLCKYLSSAHLSTDDWDVQRQILVLQIPPGGA